MLRVTADSNIYVSAFNFGGQPRRLLQLAEEGTIVLVISDLILKEVLGVLRGPKFNHPEIYLRRARAYLTRITERSHPTQKLTVVQADPDDNAILECAAASASDFIVSGDAHLLNLGRYRDIQILKVADFLRRVPGP